MLAFQDGDETAFDDLVRHYRLGVVNFIGRYLADADRAEDLAQEAFLRVYNARARYEPAARFNTWLFTIVTRLCFSEIRSRKRERKAISIQTRVDSLPKGSDGNGLDDVMGSVADTTSETPHQAVERAELEQVLEEATAALPETQRVAILMLRFHEAPYQEIAEVLGISVMAVKSMVNRARSSLRKRFARYSSGVALSGILEHRRTG